MDDLKKPFPGTNFSPWELIRSDTAIRLGIDNIPPYWAMENLVWLVEYILQPIRDHFGPIRILSGYRGLKLNEAVGGSEASMHRYGQAADIEPISPVELIKIIDWAFNNTPFYELILEYPPDGWVHIGGSFRHRQIHGKGRLKLKTRDHNYTVFGNVEELKEALREAA